MVICVENPEEKRYIIANGIKFAQFALRFSEKTRAF
jgi:hypothetical protein